MDHGTAPYVFPAFRPDRQLCPIRIDFEFLSQIYLNSVFLVNPYLPQPGRGRAPPRLRGARSAGIQSADVSAHSKPTPHHRGRAAQRHCQRPRGTRKSTSHAPRASSATAGSPCLSGHQRNSFEIHFILSPESPPSCRGNSRPPGREVLRTCALRRSARPGVSTRSRPCRLRRRRQVARTDRSGSARWWSNPSSAGAGGGGFKWWSCGRAGECRIAIPDRRPCLPRRSRGSDAGAIGAPGPVGPGYNPAAAAQPGPGGRRDTG
jgi:hypothetical protein